MHSALLSSSPDAPNCLPYWDAGGLEGRTKRCQNGGEGKELLRTEKVFAFCGLGNPADFFRTIGDRFDLRGTRAFRDHHVYSQTDIEAIENEASAAGAEVLITTGKDAVKLDKTDFRLPCFVSSIEIEIDNEDAFLKML